MLDTPVLYLSAFIINNKNDYYFNLGGVTERFAWKTWIMYILEGVEQTSYYTIQLVEKVDDLRKRMTEYIIAHNASFNQEIIKLLMVLKFINIIFIYI